MARKKDVTVEDIYSELKSLEKKGYFKGSKDEVEDQEIKVKKIEKQLKKLKREYRKLEDEQRLLTTSRFRKFEIEENKKLINYRIKDLQLPDERNFLKMLKGDDFYHIIDNGFTKTKIKHSELMKEPNIGEKVVRDYIRDINNAIEITKRKIKDPDLDKARKNTERKRLKSLNKILDVAQTNLDAIESGEMDELDLDDEKRYPFLVLIVGDRITVNS